MTCWLDLDPKENGLDPHTVFFRDFWCISYMLYPDRKSAFLMLIRIQGDHINTDPCGSGSRSTTLLKSMTVVVLRKKSKT